MKTADLCDQYGDALQVAEPLLRHYGGRVSFCGAARTLRVKEDFLLVKEALEQPGDGQVLVVDGGGSLRFALLGDILAALALRHGWSGVIVNGCIRDAAEIAAMELGVMALNTCPRRPAKLGDGERDVAVSFAGVRFTTGVYVYADSDGLLVADSACTV